MYTVWRVLVHNTLAPSVPPHDGAAPSAANGGARTYLFALFGIQSVCAFLFFFFIFFLRFVCLFAISFRPQIIDNSERIAIFYY